MKEQKIVKERGPNGEIIYKFDDEEIGSRELDWATDGDSLFERITRTIERFKICTELIDDENYPHLVMLRALILQADTELDQLEKSVKRSVGKIGFVFKINDRYPGYPEEDITAVVVCPDVAAEGSAAQ